MLLGPHHLLRRVDAVLDLSFIRSSRAEYYSHTGRPSIDPELMIRMLLVGYLSRAPATWQAGLCCPALINPR